MLLARPWLLATALVLAPGLLAGCLALPTRSRIALDGGDALASPPLAISFDVAVDNLKPGNTWTLSDAQAAASIQSSLERSGLLNVGANIGCLRKLSRDFKVKGGLIKCQGKLMPRW